MKIKNILFKTWNSPTITTWFSYFAKAGNALLVLPLILNRFNENEVAIWYLFLAIISFGTIADFGFRSTFIRLIAFAKGGAKEIRKYNKLKDKSYRSGSVNWDLVEKLYSMMRYIYVYVSIFVLILFSTAGTYSLVGPISKTNNEFNIWISWIIICITASIEFYGKIYKNYLEGLYKIALVKRMETLFKTGSILSSFAVMIWAPSIINLVIVKRVWTILNVIRDKYLSLQVYGGRLKQFSNIPFDKKTFYKIWSPAWRSGISSLMSNGLSKLTGVLYAQIGSTSTIASYLLAEKIITEIKNISNAPFYSKIPLLSKLRSADKVSRLIEVSKRGMNISYGVFIMGALIVGILSEPIFNMIGSDTDFVDPSLWWLMALAYFIHRVGSMNMQLYITTNHVISHIVDGISGFLFIITSFLLLKEYGVYAFPIGMIVGYLSFHLWISCYYSFTSLKENILPIFVKYLFMPFLVISLLVLLTLYNS